MSKKFNDKLNEKKMELKKVKEALKRRMELEEVKRQIKKINRQKFLFKWFGIKKEFDDED